MKESDFLSFKRELWDIIRSEGIVVTNQNLDALLEEAFMRVVRKNAEDILSAISHSIAGLYVPNTIASAKESKNADLHS